MKIVIGLAEMDFILTLLAILTVIKNDKKIKKIKKKNTICLFCNFLCHHQMTADCHLNNGHTESLIVIKQHLVKMHVIALWSTGSHIQNGTLISLLV